ncbi:MATE family efflux transporter [Methylopila sp. Yamaguchi]|uniref:MATE family efflux transporter n=1 Tax=Methylopila sp. Yamaguchi TaxID=1437817 RepID=UPI000CA9A845|nr:MATE family efflux transporter [Methylopila sp. Yamaguchi]GBD48364.1 MATE efflux family protein 2 [Methylopila sp. Yamaguchi]
MSTAAVPAPTPASLALDPRTLALLNDPVAPLILRMAWPNLAVMLLQASTGLIETYWVGRLGPDALAGMALVFPPFMLMQMLSVGAMGGGVSSAVARALGAGRREDADKVVSHGVALFAGLGLAFSALMLAFGEPFYRLSGAEGGALEAALAYSNVVFAGTVLLWVMNALASALRGTGDMLVPAGVVCFGVVLIVPLSPLLIYGFGPLPGLGVAGGGWAIVTFNALGCGFLLWYARSGRSVVRLTWSPLEWRHMAEILKVGALASLTSIQTNLIFIVVTALVGHAAGAAALAGYGTGARLEYLLIPLAFGFGAPLVPLVGTNVGAGAIERAKRIAFTGAALAFVTAELIGVAAALVPAAWLSLFSADAAMIDAGAAYLRIAGPAYGFFAFGMALYFAAQGAGRLGKPLAVTLVRTLLAIGGAALAFVWAAPLWTMFAAVSLALVVYGVAMGLLTIGADWDAARQGGLVRPGSSGR